MTTRAKVTLASAIFLTGSIVYGVHWLQEREHQVLVRPSKLSIRNTESPWGQTMYQGVIRDDERRRQKKLQRQQEFDDQERKRALYEAVQPVASSPSTPTQSPKSGVQ